MSRQVINEASAFTVRARFFDNHNAAIVPTTVRYRIKDVSNDRIVRDWTTLQPASAIDIDIAAGDNNVYQDRQRPFQRFEERVLTIQANHDTDDQFMDEMRYLIKNLRGFDS